MRVEIRKESVGWDIQAKDDDGNVLRTAYGDTGSSAYNKASILADYYRDDNGQSSQIIWIDKLN